MRGVLVLCLIGLVLLMAWKLNMRAVETVDFAVAETDSVSSAFLEEAVPFMLAEEIENLDDAKVVAGDILAKTPMAYDVQSKGYLKPGVHAVRHPWVMYYNNSSKLADVVIRLGDVVRPLIVEEHRTLCLPYGWTIDHVVPKTLHVLELRSAISMMTNW